jgi:hypothetical protein
MGRRYMNTMQNKKDLITYSIYVQGEFKEDFVDNREAALMYVEDLKNNMSLDSEDISIMKTRIQVNKT